MSSRQETYLVVHHFAIRGHVEWEELECSRGNLEQVVEELNSVVLQPLPQLFRIAVICQPAPAADGTHPPTSHSATSFSTSLIAAILRLYSSGLPPEEAPATIADKGTILFSKAV